MSVTTKPEKDEGEPKSRYRKTEVRMWGDEKFRSLSPLPPSGQSLWIYLLIGPFTGPVPGLFKAGRAAMSEELEWSQEAFDKAFQEALDLGLVEADFKARLIWLPNAIRYNKPSNPNIVKSWREVIALMPDCDLKHRALSAIGKEITTLGPSYASVFKEILGNKPFTKPFSKASDAPSMDPSEDPFTKDMSNQRTENREQRTESKEQESKDIFEDSRPGGDGLDEAAHTPPEALAPGKARGNAPKSTDRGSRLSNDWQPSQVDIDFAAGEGWSVTSIGREADNFRDYWIAKPGAGGVKLDWAATWRTWLRNSRNPKQETRNVQSNPLNTAFDNLRARIDREENSGNRERVEPLLLEGSGRASPAGHSGELL